MQAWSGGRAQQGWVLDNQADPCIDLDQQVPVDDGPRTVCVGPDIAFVEDDTVPDTGTFSHDRAVAVPSCRLHWGGSAPLEWAGARTHRRRRAFTLIEVIVTIALLMALIGAMSFFSFNVLRSREQTLATTQRQLAAALVGEPGIVAQQPAGRSRERVIGGASWSS